MLNYIKYKPESLQDIKNNDTLLKQLAEEWEDYVELEFLALLLLLQVTTTFQDEAWTYTWAVFPWIDEWRDHGATTIRKLVTKLC